MTYKELENLLDELILNSMLAEKVNKNLSEACEEFNNKITDIDILNIGLDENLNYKLAKANEIFRELLKEEI